MLFKGHNRTTFYEKNDKGNDCQNDNNAMLAITLPSPNQYLKADFRLRWSAEEGPQVRWT